MRHATLLLLGALVTPAGLHAQDFRWHAPMSRGKTLEVRGISGSIRAVRASGGEAEVTATKHARKGDPAEVEIRMVERGNRVIICALYPRKRGGVGECDEERDTDGDRMKDTDVSVDFAVKVPSGVDFVGRNVNGDVSATDLDGDARLSTVNGDVDVGASGTARGTTVNGSVTARVGKAEWDGTLSFSTVNGGIRVTLPASLDADVEATTVNGSIDSDFPITIQGRMQRRAFRGRIGQGGRRLELTTVNGSIELRKGS